MAKINEQVIVITLSELLKDNEKEELLISDLSQLELIVKELIGREVLIEIESKI